MQQLLATLLRIQFLELTNGFSACDKMSEFLFTLQTGLDIIDIISRAATTQVILAIIQGCVMPRMCYVAPKAFPKLDLSRVPTPHTGRPSYTFQNVLVGILNSFITQQFSYAQQYFLYTEISPFVALAYLKAVFRILEVMMRIRTRESGSRSGSCFFLQ